MKKIQTVLITGLSGSGKSTALNTLEDMGFFCIDNLPANLIPHIIKTGLLRELRKTALSMDAREGRFIQRHRAVITELKEASSEFDMLFLEADTRVLQRRFSVTRRRHPLAQDRSLAHAIRLEKMILKDLRDAADRVFDTSKMSPRALYHQIEHYFSKRIQRPSLDVSIVSFGFHHGTPQEADLMMDVRFIPNPNFVASLRRRNGTHPSVKRYVLDQKESRGFIKHFVTLLRFLIPKFRSEGKSYLTIAIGCTGGQHRSVVMAEEIFRILHRSKFRCHVVHRDLGIATSEAAY